MPMLLMGPRHSRAQPPHAAAPLCQCCCTGGGFCWSEGGIVGAWPVYHYMHIHARIHAHPRTHARLPAPACDPSTQARPRSVSQVPPRDHAQRMVGLIHDQDVPAQETAGGGRHACAYRGVRTDMYKGLCSEQTQILPQAEHNAPSDWQPAGWPSTPRPCQWLS